MTRHSSGTFFTCIARESWVVCFFTDERRATWLATGAANDCKYTRFLSSSQPSHDALRRRTHDEDAGPVLQLVQHPRPGLHAYSVALHHGKTGSRGTRVYMYLQVIDGTSGLQWQLGGKSICRTKDLLNDQKRALGSETRTKQHEPPTHTDRHRHRHRQREREREKERE